MEKTKIFTIGGATFDIFVKTNQQAVMSLATSDTAEKYLCLKHGGKVKVEHVVETFGGGATNTAVAFARMGLEAFFVGKIGSAYGDKVVRNLKENGVHTDFVGKTEKDKTAFSTIISIFDGDRTVLTYAGANRFFNEKDLPVKKLEKTDWIFFNHLAEGGGKIPEVLFSVLKKNPDIKMAWNPGHEQFMQGVKRWKALLAHTEILFVNKEEAALFTKIPYRLAGMKREDPRFHVHLLRDFLPPYADDVTEIMLEFFKYGVKNVVITDGRN
ncbi:carbohydrate kinase family protein, partial [Candidatus Peregrinibacteria bacterium]|nr:carbohydrate kinase family protein [Candidatus Peregrinibacteria bacterium]